MENQINVEDQKTQKIGQNPTNLSVKIPEKNKEKHFILSILFFLIGFFVSLSFIISFVAGDIPDYIVARSIPRYPNASRWKASANSGFPDGRPSGTVNFLTNDIPQSVYDFYQTELPKSGWKSKHVGQAENIEYLFIKRLGNHKYSLSIINRNNLYHKSTDFWWNWWINIQHD